MPEETEVQQEATAKFEPQVSLEELSPSRIRVTMEVQAQKVGDLIEQRYQKLNEMVGIPGFRRGHAPRALLERKFSKDVMQELRDDIIAGCFREAQEEKKFQPLGEPVIQDLEKLQIQQGQPFRYSVEIEVVPKVEVKNYAGLKVKRVKLEATPADVDRQIEILRRDRALWEPFEGTAEPEDQVVVDIGVVAEGKETNVLENKEFSLVPDIAIFGQPEPEFFRSLLGKKAGDTATYGFKAADASPVPGLAGKQVTLEIKVKGVRRRRLPEMDAAFLREFDCDTPEEFRQEVVKSLARARETEAKDRMIADLLSQLVSAHPVEIPESLVHRWAEQLPASELRRLLHSASGSENVRLSVHQNLLLERIAEQEKIFVTEEEIATVVERMVRDNDLPSQAAVQLQDDPLFGRWLRRTLRGRRTLEWMLEKAAIEE